MDGAVSSGAQQTGQSAMISPVLESQEYSDNPLTIQTGAGGPRGQGKVIARFEVEDSSSPMPSTTLTDTSWLSRSPPQSPGSPESDWMDSAEESMFHSRAAGPFRFPPGYIPKRKNETPEQRELRKSWERENLTHSMRKQLRAAKREHKKAARALKKSKECEPEVQFKNQGPRSSPDRHKMVAAARLQSNLKARPATSPEINKATSELTSLPTKPRDPLNAASPSSMPAWGAKVEPVDTESTPPEKQEDDITEEKTEVLPVQQETVEWACYCLHRNSRFRRVLVKFVEWPRFDQFILLVIVVNCIALALYDPLDQDCVTDLCKVLAVAELVFNVIFIVEMLLKMGALGVFGSGGYFDNGWNCLDFAIVCTSIVDFFPGSDSSLSAFRAFRVLRPLRAINRFPNLRVLVKLLLNTLPMLASVGVLCFLLFFVLGVVGMQLWAGVLQQRCVDPTTNIAMINEAEPFVCTQPVGVDEVQYGWQTCPPADYPTYTECHQDKGNPFWGSISFDHSWAAWVTLFQVLTLEAWVDIMYLLQDSYSFHVWVYFFAVVLLCAVFALNLVLVVISSHFAQTKADDLQEMADVEDRGQTTAAVTPEDEAGQVNVNDAVPEYPWRVQGRRVIESSFFMNTVMVAIIINMLFMAAEHHGQSQLQTDIADVANSILCWAFFGEMTVKLVVLGFSEYFSDSFNCFDAIIVAVSLVEFFTAGSGGLSVLRTFRLVRALKLIRFIESLQLQLAVILRTLSDMVAFFVLLFLFIFIFAILGMSLFGGQWNFAEGVPRKNFDSFLWALITVFQVLTLEDWNVVLYDAVRAGGMITPLYFIALIILGNFIILNLFVAILISGFEESGPTNVFEVREEDRQHLSKEVQLGKTAKHQKVIEARYNLNGNFYDTWDLAERVTAAEEGKEFCVGAEVTINGIRGLIVSEITESGSQTVYNVRLSGTFSERHCYENEMKPVHFEPESSHRQVAMSFCGALSQRDMSLCCLSRDCCLRRACCWLISKSWFEGIVMALILGNSVCIAIVRPGMSSSEKDVLERLGYVFTGAFTLEMLLKIIAMNLVLGPEDTTYLSDGWNRLDCFLVITSWVDVAFSIAGIGSSWIRVIRVMRMIRTLRPLRMINKAKKLRDTVNSLIQSLKPLGSTLIIIVFVFLIFGILGMQLFSGKFYHCIDLSEEVTATIETAEQCIAAGGRWENQTYNFDNLGESFITLFVVATIDGWVEVMYQGTDVVGEGYQPKQNASELSAAFFVVFVMVGAFFTLNIFVGVVVENFQQARRNLATTEFAIVDVSKDGDISRDEFAQIYGEETAAEFFRQVDADGSGSVSREEFLRARLRDKIDLGQTAAEVVARNQVTVETVLQKDIPYEEQLEIHFESMDPGSCYAAAFRLSQSHAFETAIFSAIMLNIVMMTFEFYNQPALMDDIFLWLNTGFTVIFMIEAAIKLVGLGCRLYWKDPWNGFDMFVVVVSIIGSVLDFVGTDTLPIEPTILRLLRILRLARVLKLLKQAQHLVILLGGVAGALPHVLNLTILLLLLFFIFSAMGVELYGTIACDDAHPCHGMGEYANFRNMGMGMLTLFRITTGDNWNGIFKDALRTSPDCSTEEDCEGVDANCCTGIYLSIPYFLVFNIVSQLVILNIIVALLMEELERATLDIAKEKAEGELRRDLATQAASENQEEPTQAAECLDRLDSKKEDLEPTQVQELPVPADELSHKGVQPAMQQKDQPKTDIPPT